VLAARQASIKTIILPRLNRRDVLQVNPRILHGIQFEYVDNVDQVLAVALYPPEPKGALAPGTPVPAASGTAREIPVSNARPGPSSNP
jgi:hypothetical protein